jgi:hypothetical protein
MSSNNTTKGRPSKYRNMAESLLEQAGFNTNGRAKSRIEKITVFLRNNYKNANQVFVTDNYKEAEQAKKCKLVGYSNSSESGGKSSSCWVALK